MSTVDQYEDRRRTLVRSARKAIATHGIQSATIRLIANEAGCAKGTLTHYFSNRADMLTQCLLLSHHDVRDRTDIRIHSECFSGLRALRALLIEALPLDETRILEAKTEISFYGAAVGDKLLRKTQNDEVATFRERIRRQLLEARDAEEIPVESDIEMMIDLCQFLIDGISIRSAMLMAPPPETIERYVDTLLESFSNEM